MNLQGNDLGIYIDSTTSDGTTTTIGENNYRLVACSTSCSLSYSNATIETNCKSSTDGDLDSLTHRITTPGQASWSITVDGLVDMTGDDVNGAETGFDALMDFALSPSQTIYAAFSTGDNSIEYWGKVVISDISATAAVDDYATYSATLTGDGVLYERGTHLTNDPGLGG